MSEIDKLTTENLKARLPLPSLVTKTDFDTELTSLNEKVTSNKSKHLLIENELKKFKKMVQVILKVKTSFKKMVARII